MQKSDPDRRRALSERLRAHEAASDTALSVSLEDFFEGNHDHGSIGCNLNNHPGLQHFYGVLRSARALIGVQGVYVQLAPYESPMMWPFSSTIHFITRLSVDQIRAEVGSLHATSVSLVPPIWEARARSSLPQPEPGFQIVTLWWD